MASLSDAEPLRPFLEQACRETLKELSRNAVESEGGDSKSIECIVRSVAKRILEEAGGTLPQIGSSATSPANSVAGSNSSSTPPTRLLQDIAATPWLVWRGFSRSSEKQQQQQQHEASLRERQDSLTITVDDSPKTPKRSKSLGWQDETKATTDSRIRSPTNMRRNTISNIGCSLKHVQSAGDMKSLLRQTSTESAALSSPRILERRGSKEDAPICLPGSGVGDQPMVCRNGLTLKGQAMQSLYMQWQPRPRTCLLIVKKDDQLLLSTLQEIGKFLTSQGILIVLEPQALKEHPDLNQALPGVRTFSEVDRLERSIDLVITIGGDGTLTWAVSLFHRGMPPVLAFAAGSLGFLTPFPLNSWAPTLTSLLDLHCERIPQPLVCRMRLRVTIRRRGNVTEKSDVQVQCMNEVLVHRGASGSLVKLSVTVDGEKVTLVQGDGLILSTPTGSTAYSLAAGGSMVHPAVPGILLTPVSPHSLSFRPALLPDSASVRVEVPLTARCGAVVSVDGKDLSMLKLGDAVEVAVSSHPVPTICHTTETKDWFSSVQSGLQWNIRTEQKAA
jgi:NAD+ kinase